MRKTLRQLRQKLTPQEKKSADMEIITRLLMTEDYYKCDLILCYASTAEEINTFPLIYTALANHKKVGLPRCNGDILDFYYINSKDDLKVGSFGILEPDVTKCKRILDYRESLLIAPGLGFSPDGNRIGYGRGYYDRFISHYKGKVVGMCYNSQVKLNIPVESTDQKVNVLITEKYTRNI